MAGKNLSHHVCMAIFHFFSEGRVDSEVPHVHHLKFRMFLAQKEKIQDAKVKTVKMLFVLLYPV